MSAQKTPLEGFLKSRREPQPGQMQPESGGALPQKTRLRPLGVNKCYHITVLGRDSDHEFWVPDPARYEGCSAGFGTPSVASPPGAASPSSVASSSVVASLLHAYKFEKGKIAFFPWVTLLNAPLISLVEDEPVWWHLVEAHEKKLAAKAAREEAP